ncbi:MAG: ABC transporter ATP-binding protein [Deltaproteobacteria bacterium]|nr:ABC transporter ATP-binding protein [Deltaproteobacteria bacterium]
MKTNSILLQVKNLFTWFYTVEGIVKAVDGVSFHLEERQTLGLVGESGCGKSMTVLSILKLLPKASKIVQGEIIFDNKDLVRLSETSMRGIRGKSISMIFQEPMTSLNPVMTIGAQISEAILTHQGLQKKEAINQAIEMLQLVGISTPEKRAFEYPHQMSGGMRQRAMIAMALACQPKLLIADEPTTALDVTIQAQILDLMQKLKEKTGTAIILITHNLPLVVEMMQKVGVMYSGRLVELANVIDLFKQPLHPYTDGLLRSIPWIHQETDKFKNPLNEIPGDVPSLLNLPEGCKFYPRCSHAFSKCTEKEPPLKEVTTEHWVRCWLRQ